MTDYDRILKRSSEDGSYMEFYDAKDNLWEAHAMGDGDFNNHIIKFNRVY